MAAHAPPQVPPGRASALLGALAQRAEARLALHEALLEMEARLARVEPVPLEVLQAFERRMAELRAVQDRVAALAAAEK